MKTLFGKLAFAFLTLQVLLFLGIYIGVNDVVDDFITTQKAADNKHFEELFVASVAPSLFSEDYGAIQRFLYDLKKNNSELIYIEIRDIDQRKIASIGKLFSASSIDDGGDRSLDVINLQLSGEKIGTALYAATDADYESLVSSLFSTLIFLIVILGVLGLVIAFFATRYFTRGLSKLHEASTQLTSGIVPEIELSDAKDEIGDLTRNFKSMVHAISQRTNLLIAKEQELSSSEEKLRLALEASRDGVWDWDIRSGYVYYSERWFDIIGETSLENSYHSWENRLHPEDKARVLDSLQHHLQSLTDNWGEEFRLQHHSGRWVWVHGRGKVVERDEHHQPVRMLGTMVDIEQRKKLEIELDSYRMTLENRVEEKTSELQAAKEQAEKANRHKSEFLSNMSHELRTPMHSILSFAALALKRCEDDEKSARYMKNIRTSGIRLTTLLNDLLDLSKLEASKMTAEFLEQDVIDIINQSIEEISSLSNDKEIHINFDRDQHFACSFDHNLLMRVVINLLSNAIKFSPDQSDIDIEVERLYEDDKNHEEMIQVSIIDQGVGIPEDQLDDIFDKFVQSSKTKTQAGGTGLGLAICKEIIELHQGNICVNSPPPGRQHGSVFYFQIPVSHSVKEPVYPK